MHLVAYFFGGLFLTNSIPHLAAGLMGAPFQTPFAKPSGVGLSSSRVNVVWGWFNALVAWLLLCKVGELDLRNPLHVAPVALAGVAFSVQMAGHFGRFHGGNDPLGNSTPVRPQGE